MRYWTANQIMKQLCSELGLPIQPSVVDSSSVQNMQLLAALNSAGNSLNIVYPWEQFKQQWVFQTEDQVGEYPLPDDWKYFVDQTQWDRTNHWPLLGPKSPQEWAWLKGGLNATAPRMRYRVMNNKFCIWPIPSATTSNSAGNPNPGTFAPFEFAMEYVQGNWVLPTGLNSPTDMVTDDGDIVWYDPWLIMKYAKVKFYQLKQFDTTAVEADFMLVFDALTGKDVGGGVLSLSPGYPPQFLGVWNVPDGSWNTGAP